MSHMAIYSYGVDGIVSPISFIFFVHLKLKLSKSEVLHQGWSTVFVYKATFHTEICWFRFVYVALKSLKSDERVWFKNQQLTRLEY